MTSREWTEQDEQSHARFIRERKAVKEGRAALPPELPETPIGQLYRLTSPALGVLLFRVGLPFASTLGDARRELLRWGGGNVREMYRKLRSLQHVGPKTADLLCSVLGFDPTIPPPHCRTCICRQ